MENSIIREKIKNKLELSLKFSLCGEKPFHKKYLTCWHEPCAFSYYIIEITR